MPLISVLMPAYNSEKYIADAIYSILMQTFSDFELLIINDGSIDNTEIIVNSFTDPRIKYIKNKKNRGLIYTLNKGLKLAKGKYVARMDSDDISHVLRFEKQINYLEANKNISLLGTAFKIMNTDDIVYHPVNNERIRVSLLIDTVLAHPSVMLVREDFKKNKLIYDNGFPSAEDYRLWTQVSLSHLKIANLNDVLLEYRIHESQISIAKISEQYDSVKKIREGYAKAIYGNDLNANEYNIIKNGFKRGAPPYLIILLLLKMRSINNQSSYFNHEEFELFSDERINNLISILGKCDIFHLLLSSSPLKLKFMILRKYVGKIVTKKL